MYVHICSSSEEYTRMKQRVNECARDGEGTNPKVSEGIRKWYSDGAVVPRYVRLVGNIVFASTGETGFPGNPVNPAVRKKEREREREI